jgi:hypothetical protein
MLAKGGDEWVGMKAAGREEVLNNRREWVYFATAVYLGFLS